MKRLLVLFALAAATALWAAGDRTRPRSFEIEETVRLAVPAGAGGVRLWIPKPANTSHQTAKLLAFESPWPHKLTQEAGFGNELFYLESNSPKTETLEVRLRYHVSRKEQRASLKEGTAEARDLEPRGLVVINDEIRKIARETTAGLEDPVEKARSLYHYVFSRMSYDKTGSGWGRGDVVYACSTKKGNCTDFHSLFAALAMASGIPTRFKMGYSLPQASEGELGSGYHCWAEFHASGKGWIPVDISEAWKRPARAHYYFGHLDKDRVLVSTGRELQLAPPQRGAPLNYLSRPYAEADGKPLPDLEFQRRYKNL